MRLALRCKENDQHRHWLTSPEKPRWHGYGAKCQVRRSEYVLMVDLPRAERLSRLDLYVLGTRKCFETALINEDNDRQVMDISGAACIDCPFHPPRLLEKLVAIQIQIAYQLVPERLGGKLAHGLAP
ncbi:uncharacterized protein MYCFIDRAFT_208143 [Pseudocercospora fijiensis CIRAD86]|uniref:Uncharacterized protein n=1 Tax=Pseudocercospora fijiensis (strain CIRAD86) TaxID=383855 RepID=M3ATA0_PSEFD|nr:uncharacterized protein MYCFIDRAFT_208143 [Pseudocercospora fijiensis CIRAD86]EME80702.1 hypothetical protein MYCFIDRAFT_208143 [Pseudocercospora fijiensis CIRAD86]